MKKIKKKDFMNGKELRMTSNAWMCVRERNLCMAENRVDVNVKRDSTRTSCCCCCIIF